MRIFLLCGLLLSLNSNCFGTLKKPNCNSLTHNTKSHKKHLDRAKIRIMFEIEPIVAEWLKTKGFRLDPNTPFDFQSLIRVRFCYLADRTKHYETSLTPLGLALRKADIEIITWILEAGIDPNRAVDNDGRSALAYLIKNLNPDDNKMLCQIVQLLIDHNAQVNDFTDSTTGTTLLHHLAACAGYQEVEECIKLLVKYGANCNAVDTHGMVPVNILLNGYSNCSKTTLNVCRSLLQPHNKDNYMGE